MIPALKLNRLIDERSNAEKYMPAANVKDMATARNNDRGSRITTGPRPSTHPMLIRLICEQQYPGNTNTANAIAISGPILSDKWQ